MCTYLCRGTGTEVGRASTFTHWAASPVQFLFSFMVCVVFTFVNFFFPRNGATWNIFRCFKGFLRLLRICHVFPFCAFYCIYLFCCSLKSALWNCSIYFLSWKCQCIYVMKMPICMYIFKISIEMIKAVQDWSIIIFDLAFLILPPSVILGFDIYYHPLRFWP